MDNAARALEIAAGVLLGVMLFALVAYFFTSIGGLPQEEDDVLTAEQLQKFNMEYEIYNKNRMYGVDVISCLNKAKSNNEKYVSGGKFLVGSRYGDEHLINVVVKINSELQESIEQYRIVNGKSVSVLGVPNDPNDKYNTSKLPYMKDIFKNVKGSYTEYSEDDQAGYGAMTDTMMAGHGINKQMTVTIITDDNNPNSPRSKSVSPMTEGVEYNLTEDGMLNSLVGVLQFSGDYMRQVAYNTTNQDLDTWSSMVWNTALYDFKKRQFYCKEMGYNKDTGKINRIVFYEYDPENPNND